MKRIISFIICAVILFALPLSVYAADDDGVLITVVIPQAPQPAPAPEPEPPEITVFPVAVYENREGNRREIIRVYELWEHESAAQIPRRSFEREGFHFELAEITRQSLPGFSTREHSEIVTVNTQTNDLASVIQLLSPTLDFATEDGYFGVLTLDIGTIQMEQAGTRTTNSTVTTTREFPHLSAPDMALVPRTVTDRNRTYNLTDVQWREQGGSNIDYRDVATSFTAVATYSRTATSTVITGFVTTAEYRGTVSRISTEVTRYTAYFLGVPILSPVISTPSSEPELPPEVCDDYGIANVCECYEVWAEFIPTMPDTGGNSSSIDNGNGDEYPYADDEPDSGGYDEMYTADIGEDESEPTERGNMHFIATIAILLLVIIGLICFINRARLIGFISRIKAGRGVAVLLVMLMVAQFTITSVYAAPPPYSFGGGQMTEVHINDNRHAGNARDRPVNFAANIPTTYQYGDAIGTLHVERLNRTVRVIAGATMEAMDSGAGHFSFTGLNSGNTGLVGHNRGSRNGFFSFVRQLQQGDIITLTAGGITRSYAVSLQYTTGENDFSPLMAFGDNRLTLVTCVEYQPGLRRVAVATEIRE